MLSESEILLRGKIKNVVLALDDGDDHYPSGHWLNSTGVRMYSEDRVLLAEELVDSFQDGCYYHKDADRINALLTPVTKPFVIIDYRLISRHIVKLFPIRKYPKFNPFASFDDRVSQLRLRVLGSLLNISNYTNIDLNITNETELNNYLDLLLDLSYDLYAYPWPNAILRPQVMKRNIYGGKSRIAALRVLKILALIRRNVIDMNTIASHGEYFNKDHTIDICKLLAVHPILRLDYRICSDKI